MSGLLKKVQERKTAPEAIAHRIALHLSSHLGRAGVVEAGDDMHFYGSLLRTLKPKSKVEWFVAFGRFKVIATVRVLQALGKKENYFAIVDRDFHFADDQLIENGTCLVLAAYSFENLFADRNAIVEIGQHFFALEIGGDAMKEWTARVDRFMIALECLLLEEHAIALWCHRNQRNCNLKDFNLSAALIVENNGDVRRKTDTTDCFLRDTGADLVGAASEEVLACRQAIANLPWQSTFRGHYFITLLTKLLNSFRSDLDNYNKSQKDNRARTRAEISERNTIEGGTMFVPIPAYLETFLRSKLT